MTGARGPRSKPDAIRRRGNNTTPRVAVTAPGAPPLAPPPAALEYDGPPEKAPTWSPQTIEWYRVWAESDYAKLFDATDWNQLQRMAPIVESFWSTFDVALMKEVEAAEERMRRRTDGRPVNQAALAAQEPAPKQRRTGRNHADLKVV
jgi:hypothetical protein